MSQEEHPEKKQNPKKKRRHVCHACGREQGFCWTCKCGFQICPECMEENFWGMSCNAVNWTCPDCGAARPF